MDAAGQRSLKALFRRVQLMVGRGVLRLAGDGHAVQKLQAEFLSGEIRDGIERVQQYGFTSAPLAGMDVIALFLGGDRGNGVAICVNDRSFRLKGMKDGEVALYDDLGQSVHLTREGIVVKGAGRRMRFTDTPEIELDTPMVKLTGQLVAQGDITDRGGAGGLSMAGMRQVYNGHTHTEPDGETAPPVQGM